VIETEQLVAALERLSPHDREVLDFSLRRRMPDEALAKLYDWERTDVARRRAAAIERLADDLGVQSGEDLGQILKALLEPETWAAAERGKTVPEAPAVVPPPKAPRPEPEPEPEPEPASAAPAQPAGRGGSARLIAGSILAAAILIAAGVVWAAGFGGDGGGGDASQTRPFVPQGSGPLANPFPTDPHSAVASFATAFVRGRTTLYDEPAGKRKLRIRPRTEWGSQRVLGVVRQRDGWLAVQVPELPNGSVGWIPEDRARVDAVRWALRADLSRRRLVAERDGEPVRSMPIAVGSPQHMTPTGRFSVTDKLRVTDKGSPYGCCVLALTGHQTHLPHDWPGGDRLAIHATTDVGSIGKAVSLGCMRISWAEARWLIKRIPLGAPVFIRR
jgi:hypothetical protein